MPDADLRFSLRPVAESDAALLLAWRNDPATLAASGSSGQVAPHEHVYWLRRLIAAPDRFLWIAESSKKPLGQVRFERRHGYVYEISVSVDAASRGAGLGQALISRGCAVLWQDTNASRVIARVSPKNSASRRAFAAAGFRPSGTVEPGFDLLSINRPVE